MSRYDFSVTGSSVYGPGTVVPLLASPVTGASLPQGPMGLQCRVVSSYSVDVFWGSPPSSSVISNLTMTRLVRSEVGPPAWEGDGVVLVDAPTGTYKRFTDTGLRPATWYYYTIFVFDATVQAWLRGGSTDAITPDDAFDMGERLYQLLPRYYQELDEQSPQQREGGGPLKRFLSLLGFELGVIRTEIESLAHVWDHALGSAQMVPYALGQFLLEPEPELGYANQRQLLRAAVLLYATKGSAECIRMLCSTVTGWATEVRGGINLVVDNLDAQFDGSVGRWLGTNCTATWRAGDGTINAPNGIGMMRLTSTTAGASLATIYADDPRYSGIPVLQGQAYGVSVLVRGGNTDTVAVGVQFWDINGVAIGSPVTGAPVTPNTADWLIAATVKTTAPVGAWSMSLRVTANAALVGRVSYISSVMAVPLAAVTSPFPAYQPARDIRIIVRADQVNEIANPKFAADTNSWLTAVGADVTVSGGVLTRITSDEPPPVSVHTAGQLVATAAGQGAWISCPECTPEAYYTASLWVKVVSGAGVRVALRDRVTGNVVPGISITASTWNDSAVSILTVPATYELDVSVIALDATTVRFGAVLLTQGDAGIPYLDGDISSNTADYVWEGQANASRSHFYRQRTMRSYRFRELLPRFIVGGQTATLLFAQAPTVVDLLPDEAIYPSDSLFPS